jgi:hypothetical protein
VWLQKSVSTAPSAYREAKPMLPAVRSAIYLLTTNWQLTTKRILRITQAGSSNDCSAFRIYLSFNSENAFKVSKCQTNSFDLKTDSAFSPFLSALCRIEVAIRELFLNPNEFSSLDVRLSAGEFAKLEYCPTHGESVGVLRKPEVTVH